MKRTLYILSFILTLFVTVSLQAQVVPQTKKDKLVLNVYPYDAYVGFYSSFIGAIPSQYTTDVNGIVRISDNIISLKTKDQFYAQIRIEVDKGYVDVWKGDPNWVSARKMSDENGKLNEPFDVRFITVNNLTREDNDLTISIYLIKEDKLIVRKRFQLNPVIRYDYFPVLYYTDFDGNERRYDFRPLSSLPINYDAPMRLAVDDGWGKMYKADQFVVMDPDVMYNVIPKCIGDTFTTIARKTIQNSKSSVFISHVVFYVEGGKHSAKCIELKK